MTAREQARQQAISAYGENGWAGAETASDVWEPIVRRAVQILACATADCDQPPWQHEAAAFIIEYGEEAPG